jgi:hypothetical protein
MPLVVEGVFSEYRDWPIFKNKKVKLRGIIMDGGQIPAEGGSHEKPDYQPRHL